MYKKDNFPAPNKLIGRYKKENKMSEEKAKEELLKFEALVTAARKIGEDTAGEGMEAMAITNNYLGLFIYVSEKTPIPCGRG